jgi:hypothetical protein
MPSPANLVVGYEELRMRAVAAQGYNTVGFTVFLTRGMAAWLHTLQEIGIHLPQQPTSTYSQIPAGIKNEMVHVLANMVFTSTWEALHGNC